MNLEATALTSMSVKTPIPACMENAQIMMVDMIVSVLNILILFQGVMDVWIRERVLAIWILGKGSLNH